MKHIKHEKSATRSKLQPTSWLQASTTAKRSLPTTKKPISPTSGWSEIVPMIQRVKIHSQ